MKSNNITKLNYQMIFDEDGTRKDDEETERKLTEAKELLQKKDTHWKEKLEEVREEAYKKGFRDGTSNGYKKATAEIGERIGGLEKAFDEAHDQWLKNQEEIAPDLLNIVFDLTEAIIGVKPPKNSHVQEKLAGELNKLLQKIDQQTKSILYVSEEDLAMIKAMIEHYDDELSVKIQVKDSCEPGEFMLENNEMKVVRTFEGLLSDFKESLSIPQWS